MRLLEGTKWDRPPQCERCGQLESECKCPPVVSEPDRLPPAKQTARISIEKRGKGKVATVVRGLTEADNDLKKLLAKLQTACGAGGAVEGDELFVQGRHLEKVREALAAIGFKVKG